MHPRAIHARHGRLSNRETRSSSGPARGPRRTERPDGVVAERKGASAMSQQDPHHLDRPVHVRFAARDHVAMDERLGDPDDQIRKCPRRKRARARRLGSARSATGVAAIIRARTGPCFEVIRRSASAPVHPSETLEHVHDVVGTGRGGLRDGLLEAVRGDRPEYFAERAVLAPDPGVERCPADPEFLGERARVEPLARDPAPAR